MNILEEIVARKHAEVAERKSLYPVKLLERSVYFETPAVSLKKYLRRPDKSGIIAEFKRKSPSKGFINKYAQAEQVSIAYMQAGASALSVLTDQPFFGGSSEDLSIARKFNYCPILRKEFIIDEYQILEAKAIGADAILLIAAILEPSALTSLTRFAQGLGLEVLTEVHDAEELSRVEFAPDLIGVNNRNLKTFAVSLDTSLGLSEKIPAGVLKVSESGISDPASVGLLRGAGFEGFLIGEQFMKHSNPGAACSDFIRQLPRHEN